MHTLVLDVPPSANRYKSRRVVQLAGKAPLVVDHLTHEARQYKEAAQWVARAAGIREPSLGRIAMQIDLYPQRPLDWQARATHCAASLYCRAS
jgi:crossover junction endodeoxyribonuclease RusA